MTHSYFHFTLENEIKFVLSLFWELRYIKAFFFFNDKSNMSPLFIRKPSLSRATFIVKVGEAPLGHLFIHLIWFFRFPVLGSEMQRERTRSQKFPIEGL